MHYTYYDLVDQPQYFIDSLYDELARRNEAIKKKK